MNMVAALFTHDLSRNRDPQLHVHAVIANATQRPDGAWRALRNDPLYGQQATIAAVHNADLRARIEGLGYRTVPANNPVLGQFEIAGISREHIMAFSTRREEIAAALEASGREGSAAERELAALATRAAKDPGISREEDRAAWAERAARIGFDPAPLREAALVPMEPGATMWVRMLDGIKGMAAKGQAIVAAMGLSPREKDPLVPERSGRLSPQAYAAAQAVASGVRHLSQNEAGFILDTDRGRITFMPGRVARNLGEDSVGLYEERRIALHQGDSIRFSANNHALGVLNAQVGNVEALDATRITIAMGQDRRLNLALDDPALRRLDLAYALNAYAAQGVTTRHGIVVMDSSEVMLASSRTLAVALTRIADQPRLVIDSTHRLEQAVTRNSAAKLSALDILENPAAVHLPEAVREAIPGRQVKQAAQVEHDQQRLSRDTLRIPLDMRRAIEASLPVVQLENRPEKSLDLSL